MTMSRAGPPLMAGWLVLSAIVAASAEEAKDTDNALSPLATALTQGRPSLDLRYRFEHVDQKGFSRDARANTVRARFRYETGAIHGFYLFFEGDGVAEIGGETFNDTVNGRAQFPVIADDDTIELNQGYLNYQGLANTNFRLGRQRIKLDNDRFIGNAGFRQNEQTFDAALVSHAPLPGLDLTYAFVDHVNRVFGDDARLGDFDSNTHLFNATHDGFGWGRITLYDYLIEVDDDAPAFSSNSTGLRLDGDHTFRFNRDLTALYEAEFAYQTDHSDNPGDYGLTYYQIGPGVRIRDLTVRLGYEVLGGNGTNAFQTPFTSVHKFNGATDRFATIPVDGLRDSSVSLAYVVPMDRYLGDLRLSAAAHDFRAEDNGTRYGTEWSLKLTKFFDLSHIVNASVRAVFDLEYASYDADAFSSDTDKFWATLQLRYN